MAKSKQEGEHNVTFAEGGDTHMFSQQAAEPSEAGVTVDKSGKDSAPGAKYAKGGSTKMFGFHGAEAQQPGRTSAR